MLLDGRYEISAERPLSAEQTLFEATAADGALVRIIWYTLADSPAEQAFERYRQVLRALRREDAAAVQAVVARPGATYVAWQTPPANQRSDPSPVIAQVLASYGYRPEEADVRLGPDGKPRVYGLAFAGTLPEPPPTSKPLPTGHQELPPWLLTLAPGLLLALLGIGLLVIGLALRTEHRVVILPPINGQDVTTLANTLYHLGVQVQAEPVPSDRAIGTVLALEPEAGSQIRPGRTVLLRYAVPYDQLAAAEVPDLRGRPLESELQRLSQQRLTLGEVARIPAEAAAGIVLSQQPAAGTRVAQGSQVDVLISDGPVHATTFLPDLRGLPREEAFFLARVAGIAGTIEVEEVSIPRRAVGTVVAQNLEPGVLVAADSVILRLTVVGSGVANFDDSTPTFIGLSLAEAKALASRHALTISTLEIENLNLPQGIVLQDPPVGEAVRDAVHLTVNVHPQPLPLPNVSVVVHRPIPRRATFAWPIEAGIPEQEAVVTASTVTGDRAVVYRSSVRGGQRVEGVWLTFAPGPITFTLTLNGEPYSVPLRVNP